MQVEQLLLITARRLSCFIFLLSFVKLSRTVSQLLSGHDFYTENYKGYNSAKNLGGQTVLISARRLVMLYISTKFCDIISNGIKVIERTQFLY